MIIRKLSCHTLEPQSSRQQHRHCQSDIDQVQVVSLCRTWYIHALLVYNPSRPCLFPECEFNLNQTRSLSPTRIYPLTKHAFHIICQDSISLLKPQIFYVQYCTWYIRHMLRQGYSSIVFLRLRTSGAIFLAF